MVFHATLPGHRTKVLLPRSKFPEVKDGWLPPNGSIVFDHRRTLWQLSGEVLILNLIMACWQDAVVGVITDRRPGINTADRNYRIS